MVEPLPYPKDDLRDRNFTKEKKIIIIDEKDITESFVRGSGPGGQKINKNRSRVQLHHLPTNLTVSFQEHRDLHSNRVGARKLLRDKIDLLVNKEDSKINQRHELIRKRKRNAARRAKKKYGNINTAVNSQSDDDDDDDEIDKEDINDNDEVKNKEI